MHRREFLAAAAPFALFGNSNAKLTPERMKFFAPVIERIADDDEFRKDFVDFAREHLGMSRFNRTLYNLMLDAKPEVRCRPMVLRMMERIIWGAPARRRIRLFR